MGPMYLTEPKSQYRFLVKHFFRRFFDLESIAPPHVETNVLLVKILFLLAVPGTLASLFLEPKYVRLMFQPFWEPDLAKLDDKCFFISMSMILLGFIAAFEWDTLFPDRKDYLILTPLPIATRTIFLAKIAALAAFLLAFTVTIDLGPTILFPLEVLTRKSSLLRCAQYVASHGITVLLGNIFIFFTAISLQGILFVLLPQKVALIVSRYIRFFFFLLLLCAVFSFPGISSVQRLVETQSPIAAFYPPIWFVGVYEILLGSQVQMWGDMAFRALAAITLTGVVSVLTYAICYQRFLRRSIESGTAALFRQGLIRTVLNFVLDRWLLPRARHRALFHFVGQTVFRSPRHTLYIGSFLAIGVSTALMGLITIAFTDDWTMVPHLDKAILSVPLVLSFFVLVGTKISFAVPVDLDANWLFRLAPDQTAKSCYAGIRAFLICGMLLPLLVSVAFLYRLLWSGPTILLHACFSLVLSLLLIEWLLSRLTKIPFTCSYIPAPAERVFKWPLYYIGFGCYAYVAAGFEGWLLREPRRVLSFCAMAGALWIAVIFRHAFLRRRETLHFEEECPTAPIYLDLSN